MAAAAHQISDLLHEVDGADNVCVYDLAGLSEVLIEEALTKPPAGVGHQQVNGAARCLDCSRRRSTPSSVDRSASMASTEVPNSLRLAAA